MIQLELKLIPRIKAVTNSKDTEADESTIYKRGKDTSTYTRYKKREELFLRRLIQRADATLSYLDSIAGAPVGAGKMKNIKEYHRVAHELISKLEKASQKRIQEKQKIEAE